LSRIAKRAYDVVVDLHACCRDNEPAVALVERGLRDRLHAQSRTLCAHFDLAGPQTKLVTQWLGDYQASCLIDGCAHARSLPPTRPSSGPASETLAVTTRTRERGDLPVGVRRWRWPAEQAGHARLQRGACESVPRSAKIRVANSNHPEEWIIDPIDTYFEAWNESDAEQRRALLERCAGAGVELIDPTGRFRGIEGVRDRIGAFHQSAPGARVVKSSGDDQHNGFVRYGWNIVDPHGATVLEGIDVVELDNDGSLRRVVMFFGPLPSPD
jgi:hypothetical protein